MSIPLALAPRIDHHLDMDDATKRMLKRHVELIDWLIARDGLSRSTVGHMQAAYDAAAMRLCTWEFGYSVDMGTMSEPARDILRRALSG
jgi:hypothetical protein